MLFLTFSRADIWFAERGFVSKIYTAVEALLIIKRVEIIDKMKSIVAALNADDESFVVHVAALGEPITIPIYPSCQAQVASLMSKETGISAKYSDFSNVFSSDFPAKLLKHKKINDHPINLLDNKQPPYGPIYSLDLIELEMLKTYIKANLASGFIRLFNSSVGTQILFIQKKTGRFCLCINYRGLNNLIIKNCYLLPLIAESLNCLDCVKHFT